MQRTDKAEQAQSGRRKIQSSTTLNRRYVRRPGRGSVTHAEAQLEAPAEMQATSVQSTDMMVERSPRIRRFSDGMRQQPMQQQSEMAQAPVELHPAQKTARMRMKSRKSMSITMKQTTARPTAKELKDRAIKQALETAATSESTPKTSTKKKSKNLKVHFGFGRVMLALSCAAVAVFAIVYFVNLSMPDVSLKVAAMQTGIDAAYPNYVPRDYTISSITSENKKIVLDFKNSATGGAFTITEETSSWDSNALLSNFVKDAYGDNYTVIKEQGLTIYVSGSNAVWVNGGVVYKINTAAGSLTHKQIRSIATSL